MSDGKKHDIKASKDIEFSSGSIFVADRAYVDFMWMRQLMELGVFCYSGIGKYQTRTHSTTIKSNR